MSGRQQAQTNSFGNGVSHMSAGPISVIVDGQTVSVTNSQTGDKIVMSIHNFGINTLTTQ